MVFVLNKDKTPLNPCHPAKARWLLKHGYAVLHKKFPFVIRLKLQIENPATDEYVLKIDPGSKTTGIAVVEKNGATPKVVFLAELSHRTDIKSRLDARRALRRNRRARKTRYRQARFLNRTRPADWLPPSVQSIVDNVESWTKRLKRYCPIAKIAVETVRFDTQLMENPNVSGVEYQQGTLWGYEVREYLLYKYGHQCQYCHSESGDNVLEVEHRVSRANGGSNRIKNLILSCHTCNQDKGSLNLDSWLTVLKNQPRSKLTKTRIACIEKILTQGSTVSFKDAAKVNSSRRAMFRMLSNHTKELEVSSGGRTKFNRTQLQLPKEHYYDALCVGEVPTGFAVPSHLDVLQIKATGRGSYSRTLLDKYGFPRCILPRTKQLFGFQTGDIVKAVVPKGKHQGEWVGRVAVRSTGYFQLSIRTKEKKDGISYKYFSLLQKSDGYQYQRKETAHSSPCLKAGVSCATM